MASAAAEVPWFVAALTGAGGAGPVRLLARDDVIRCAGAIDVVGQVRDTLAAHAEGRCVLPGEAYLPWRNAGGHYTRSIAMPGAVHGGDGRSRYGLKVINASVSNPDAGLERAGGIGLCFDPETARITAIIEIGLLSAMRTAAVSAVAIDVLGRAGAGSLSVIGCGTQGRMHALLIRERLTALRRITLFDVRGDAAETLAADITRGEPDIEVNTAGSARAAVAAGEIVVLTTTAGDGYVEGEWMGAGALVLNVSLADLTDAALLGSAALYVDDLELVRENPRRPLGRLMGSGAIAAPGEHQAARARIHGTIGDLVTGRRRPVRAGDSYSVVNPFGMGILDVALLDAVHQAAAEAGAGSVIRLG